MIVERLVVGVLQTNCYVLGCETSREAVVIDPGGDVPSILGILGRHVFRLKQIVATHGHFDHILGVKDLQKATDAPFLLHKNDLPIVKEMENHVAFFLGLRTGSPPDVDGFLQEGKKIVFGQESLEIFHTPGHSPGGISLYDGKGKVCVGDTLFAGSIGRTDIPGGSFVLLEHSIKTKLFALPDNILVYPGHGPDTTVGWEKRTNPFFQER